MIEKARVRAACLKQLDALVAGDGFEREAQRLNMRSLLAATNKRLRRLTDGRFEGVDAVPVQSQTDRLIFLAPYGDIYTWLSQLSRESVP